MKQAKMNLRKLPCNLVINDLVTYNAAECSKSIPQGNKKYYELVDVQLDNGDVGERLIERDYPITPEYVKSFEQSSDYRLDVDGAIAGGHSRKNLGDVSAMQNLYAMDSAEVEALGKKLIQASNLLRQQAKNKESEVNDNGNESSQQ